MLVFGSTAEDTPHHLAANHVDLLPPATVAVFRIPIINEPINYGVITAIHEEQFFHTAQIVKKTCSNSVELDQNY